MEFTASHQHKGFQVLTADEKPSVKFRSSISQHKNKLSVMQRGEWVPISFDVLDWINCEGIQSHRAIVTDGDDIGFDFCVGDATLLTDYYATHNYETAEKCAVIISDCEPLKVDPAVQYRIGLAYALADDTLSSSDIDSLSILEPNESPDVEYHSSISQHKNKLSVMQRGEWVPISFDVLDWINCEGIQSHLAIVTDGDDIGFNFDVDEETLLSDTYLMADFVDTIVEPLPAWYGTGDYQKFVQARDFVNSDYESLGHRTASELRIGLNYALAKNTLPAAD